MTGTKRQKILIKKFRVKVLVMLFDLHILRRTFKVVVQCIAVKLADQFSDSHEWISENLTERIVVERLIEM